MGNLGNTFNVVQVLFGFVFKLKSRTQKEEVAMIMGIHYQEGSVWDLNSGDLAPTWLGVFSSTPKMTRSFCTSTLPPQSPDRIHSVLAKERSYLLL